MTATSAANSPSRGRIIAARALLVLGVLLLVREHPLDVRQAGGARLGPVQADLAAADRRSGDPGGGGGSDDRCARERRLHGLARGQAADEPPGAREPDRRPRPGLRGHGGAEPSRPAAHPGRVRRSCRALAEAVHQGPARRHEGGGHVERRRRPRHPAARPQAGGPVRVRHQSRRPDPAGRRAGHDPRGRQSGYGPEAHPLARADRELRLDLRRRCLGRRHLAGPWAPPAGGSLARHRSRRRRR